MQTQRAYSLIEMLVVLCITMTFASVTITSYNSISTYLQEKSDIQRIVALLQTAEHYALLSHVSYAVCVADQHKCMDYGRQLILFRNPGIDGSLNSHRIVERIKFSKPITLQAASYPRYRNTFIFRPDLTADNGKLSYSRNHVEKWVVLVNKLGHIRVRKGGDGDHLLTVFNGGV